MEIGAEEEAEREVEVAASGKTEGVGEVEFSEVVFKGEDQEVLETDHFKRYLKFAADEVLNAIKTERKKIILLLVTVCKERLGPLQDTTCSNNSDCH